MYLFFLFFRVVFITDVARVTIQSIFETSDRGIAETADGVKYTNTMLPGTYGYRDVGIYLFSTEEGRSRVLRNAPAERATQSKACIFWREHQCREIILRRGRKMR